MYSTGNSNQAIARHPRWVHARTIRALLTGLLGVLLAYETTVGHLAHAASPDAPATLLYSPHRSPTGPSSAQGAP
jgi:hypothetical protein